MRRTHKSGAALVAVALCALISTPVLADQQLTRDTFREIAKKVSPSVANIKIKSNITFAPHSGRIQIPPGFGLDDEIREQLERMFEMHMPNAPLNERDELKYARSGSGVVIRADGYIVTSAHVVAETQPEDVEVSLPDGRSFDKVKVVGTDELTDLAVLKVEAQNLPVLAWGDSDKLEVGDWVVAIGNPLDFNNSVSNGIVSAKHRIIKKAPIEDLIQTTAMINPGNSGGALVDLDGQLIGINMAIATNTGMWSGLGFAIPSKTARDVTDQLIAKGKVPRGYLGIEMAPLTGNLAEQLGYSQKFGIVIKNVRPGSAAETAGLQRYDIIAKVEGKEIKELNDMHRNIGARNAGEAVELTVFRDEGNKLAEKQIKVMLAERPSQQEIESDMRGAPKAPGKKPEKELMGLEVRPADGGKGLEVLSVESESRAALAGVERGDVVLQVNKQDVNSRDDLRKALESKPSDSHLFYIERKGQSAFILIPAK